MAVATQVVMVADGHREAVVIQVDMAVDGHPEVNEQHFTMPNFNGNPK